MKGPSYVAAAAWPELRVRVWKRRVGRMNDVIDKQRIREGALREEGIRLLTDVERLRGELATERKYADHCRQKEQQTALNWKQACNERDEARRQVDALAQRIVNIDCNHCYGKDECKSKERCVFGTKAWALAQARKEENTNEV